MTHPSPWITETTTATFQQDVLERSRDLPVVVDFWAAWCGPCRALGPILERLAEEYQGKFLLVKADTDAMPEIAAGFGVQSIPAVFALRDGQLVDQFVGVMPEPQIRAWLERILPSQAEALAVEAATLEQTDPAAAEARYRQVLESAPSELSARIGLARVLLVQGRLDEAEQTIDELASADALDAQGERVLAQIVLRRAAQEVGSSERWRTAAEADPKNLEIQWNLARALAAAGQYEAAMETCLRLVERDRRGLGEKARELMVHLFHLLGTDDELVSQYRRKLAMALY
jgi:putative thioredoxin